MAEDKLQNKLQQALRKQMREWLDKDGEEKFREMAKATGRSDAELDSIIANLKTVDVGEAS